jgi:hypothetical protein
MLKTKVRRSSGGNKRWPTAVWWRRLEVETSRRRSDLKEGASDLRQQIVAAKTQESARERERGTKWEYHYKVGATNYGRPYSLVFIPPG